MQTALAAKADILVTDNTTDFPLGERRNGTVLLTSRLLLKAHFEAVHDLEASSKYRYDRLG